MPDSLQPQLSVVNDLVNKVTNQPTRRQACTIGEDVVVADQCVLGVSRGYRAILKIQ